MFFRRFWRSIQRVFGVIHFKTVEKLADHCDNNPKKLANWIQRNIWYTKDTKPEHEWQSAEVTIQRRKGDCEDTAAVACDVLKLWGYDAFIFCMYPDKGPGHAVCLCLWEKSLLCFDNGKLKMFVNKSYTAIMQELKPGWVRYRIVK